MLGYDPTGRNYVADHSPRVKTNGMRHALRHPRHHYPVLAFNALASVYGFRPPWGQLLSPGSQCNCPALDYKRLDKRQE
jgi:hypothetical protein